MNAKRYEECEALGERILAELAEEHPDQPVYRFLSKAGYAGIYGTGYWDAQHPDDEEAKDRMRRLWPLPDSLLVKVFAWRFGFIEASAARKAKATA